MLHKTCVCFVKCKQHSLPWKPLNRAEKILVLLVFGTEADETAGISRGWGALFLEPEISSGGAHFHRGGAGGVECIWHLRDGSVHVWRGAKVNNSESLFSLLLWKHCHKRLRTPENEGETHTKEAVTSAFPQFRKGSWIVPCCKIHIN